MEADVLAVFYYNDLLVSHIGDGLGLNLFEPRYQEMCRRMANDPRFLFMPNYEDYSCSVGDVGFIIKVTDLRPSPSGSFGIQGVAIDFAAVECSWVEPQTRGLHYARVVRLSKDVQALPVQECTLLKNALHERGWSRTQDQAGRLILEHAEGSSARVVIGANWTDRVFLMVWADNIDKAKAIESIQESLQATSQGSRLLARLYDSGFTAAAVASGEHGLPNGPSLESVCGELLDLIRNDGLSEWSFTETLWRLLLSPCRLCGVGGMLMQLPTARLTLRAPQHPRVVGDSLPLLDADGPRKESSMVACVRNGYNVYNVFFYADISELLVTPESAEDARTLLAWRLNRPRLQLLLYARDAGQGPLAAFEDNMARAVCDFIAPAPSREASDSLWSQRRIQRNNVKQGESCRPSLRHPQAPRAPQLQQQRAPLAASGGYPTAPQASSVSVQHR